MLNQMIESKENTKEGVRRGKYFLTTLVLVTMLSGSGVVWSLFAKQLGTGDENLELSKLISPVAIAETAPPVPEAPKETNPAKQSAKSQTVLPTRTANIARTDETRYIPDKVSAAPSNQKARPVGIYTIGAKDSDEFSAQSQTTGRGTSGADDGISRTMKADLVINDKESEPPVLKKKPIVAEKTEPVETPKPFRQTLGVINGKAISLPTPPYPSAAQAVRAGGQVSVQVSIDEEGRVTSAKAVSGNPLLRSVSETAAKSARFSQTFLSGQPVKVTGVIIYNFVAR